MGLFFAPFTWQSPTSEGEMLHTLLGLSQWNHAIRKVYMSVPAPELPYGFHGASILSIFIPLWWHLRVHLTSVKMQMHPLGAQKKNIQGNGNFVPLREEFEEC